MKERKHSILNYETIMYPVKVLLLFHSFAPNPRTVFLVKISLPQFLSFTLISPLSYAIQHSTFPLCNNGTPVLKRKPLTHWHCLLDNLARARERCFEHLVECIVIRAMESIAIARLSHLRGWIEASFSSLQSYRCCELS